MSNPVHRSGGPAFPFEYHNKTRDHQPGFFGTPHLPPDGAQQFAGMSLRDHFAGLAMAIMWDAYDKGYCGLNNKDEPNVDLIAQGAYAQADAMLRARGH